MAGVDPDKLSTPERALWHAFPRGELVDLTKAWGVWARVIRAEVIAALLLGAVPPEPGKLAAVRMDGARIVGALSLGHAVIAGPVRLRSCDFDSVIDLSGVKSRDVDLAGSTLAGLTAPAAEIDGNLSLIECHCSGRVLLTGAHITGALLMRDSRLDNPGDAAFRGNRLVIDDDLVASGAVVNGELRLAAARVGGAIMLNAAKLHNKGGVALSGSNLWVGAGISACDGFSVMGQVRLNDVTIGRDLDLTGATLSNPGEDVLVARGIQVGSVLTLWRGFCAQGAIRLSRAQVGAGIFLGDARLTHPSDGDVIRCRNSRASTLVLAPGVVAEGIIDFRHSRFTVIRDAGARWPQRLRLSGLDYEALDPAQRAVERVDWLRHDVDGYVPQNYETLAAMYRRLGDDPSARIVLLARERQRRQLLPWYGRVWSWVQEVTVGYGYRPLRAGGWLAVFLVLGTLVFGLHHPPPLAGDPHPAFNPFIYTVDLLVPLVNLGLRDSYDPQGPQRWFAYFLVAAGWIFVTTIAAGIARVLRRQ
jgi:hypothetical protein